MRGGLHSQEAGGAPLAGVAKLVQPAVLGGESQPPMSGRGRQRKAARGSGPRRARKLRRARRLRLAAAAAACLAAVVVAACGLHQVKLDPTTLTPAAIGRLHLGHTPAGETTVLLQVRALAHPYDLRPPRKDYVVWVEALNWGEPVDKGVLRVGPDLRGFMRTTTSLRRFDLFITAEDQAHPSQPDGPEVLRATVGGG